MANDYYDNIFVLDTAAATLIKAALAVSAAGFNAIPRSLPVKYIRWVGPTTIGHACVLQDENSKVLWEDVCGVANKGGESPLFGPWHRDFKLVTLGSGRVYIYL